MYTIHQTVQVLRYTHHHSGIFQKKIQGENQDFLKLRGVGLGNIIVDYSPSQGGKATFGGGGGANCPPAISL